MGQESGHMIPDTAHYLLIRRLWAVDQEAISNNLLRLDAETRRVRFGGAVNDESVKAYARRILRYDSIVCGAFSSGTLRAIAELRGLYRSWPAMAEAAFSVEPDWQNGGIGDALFERVIAFARNRGVKTLYMTCLRENERMRHLAAKHHAQLYFCPGEVEATLDPNWPTPLSVAIEIADETRGLTQAMFRWPAMWQQTHLRNQGFLRAGTGNKSENGI